MHVVASSGGIAFVCKLDAGISFNSSISCIRSPIVGSISLIWSFVNDASILLVIYHHWFCP